MNKRIASLLGVFVSVMMLFGACAVKESQETATASASPEATASESIMVAEVNGEPIYYDQFYTIFSSACASYGISEDDETNGAYIKSMILESLISEKIMSQKLTENGYMDLTDEQTTQATQDAQDYLDSIIDSYYKTTIESELGEGYTDEQYEEAKAPYEEEVLTGMGYTKDEFINYYKLTVAEDAAKAELVGEILPTDDEVKAAYDENVAAEKETMDADPTQYEPTVSGGTTAYYAPEGVRMVRHVLIKIDDSESGAISTLRDAGYDDQADYLLENALTGIIEEANGVLSKLKSGSITFDEAITTYNQDTGMPETGYAVTEGSTKFVESFTAAAMGLKEIGGFSELVASDYGYHIIEYFGDVPTGAVAFDDVKQEVYDSLTATMQDEAWQTIIDEWTNTSEVVRYDDNM